MPGLLATDATSVFSPNQSELYSRNLEALRLSQPSVAGIIERFAVSDHVRAATGRDGAPTLQFVAGGRRSWLGGSSMPTISAAEMFGNSRADAGNVTLPGILTGAEALVVLERIAPYRALFVIENDPLRLKLAMHLYDYTRAMDRGRLIFVLEDDFSARLREVFEQHQGLELPTQMFTVPQRSPAATAELQRRLEQAGEGVLRLQARTTEALVRAMARRARGTLPPSPRTAVVTLDPSPATADQVRRIGRALAQLHWPTEICVPSAPQQCHVLARLKAIERIAADWVLVVNSPAHSLRPLLPDHLPLVCWFGPDAIIPSAVGAAQEADLFCAISARACEQLRCAGAPAEAVLRLPPSADVSGRPAPGTSEGIACVAVVMDVPDDRPDPNGITLPSYLALWQALQAIALRDIDSGQQPNADAMLDQARRTTGAALREKGGRRELIGLLETRIIPAAVARATARALAGAKLRFNLWGSNWPTDAAAQATRCGVIPSTEELPGVFGSADWIVLPWLSEIAVQTALDALAIGARIVLRGSPGAFTRDHPQVAPATPWIHFYYTADDLLRTLRLVRPAGHAWIGPTVANQLTRLAEKVRRKQARAGVGP